MPRQMKKTRLSRRGAPGNRLPLPIQKMIRDQRHAKNLSQVSLGERVDLSQKHISLIEKGKITPRYDTMRKVLNALGMDLIIIPIKLRGKINRLIKENEK